MNILFSVLILSFLDRTYSEESLCKFSTSRDFFDSTYIKDGSNLIEQANTIFERTSVTETLIFDSYDTQSDSNDTCPTFSPCTGFSTGAFVCTKGTNGNTSCSNERQCQPVWNGCNGRLDFEKSFITCSPMTQENSECCLSKIVGTETYTLLNETAAYYKELDCISPCVYTRDDQPGSKFCFKTGALPVICTNNNLRFPFSITNELSQAANGQIIGQDYEIDYFLESNQTKSFPVKGPPTSITAVQSGQTCSTLNNPKGFCFRIVGDMDCSVEACQ